MAYENPKLVDEAALPRGPQVDSDSRRQVATIPDLRVV